LITFPYHAHLPNGVKESKIVTLIDILGKIEKVVVAKIVGYNGDISWDQNKPDGTLQKSLDISQIKKLGWKSNIALKDGIQSVYEYYLKV